MIMSTSMLGRLYTITFLLPGGLGNVLLPWAYNGLTQ